MSVVRDMLREVSRACCVHESASFPRNPVMPKCTAAAGEKRPKAGTCHLSQADILPLGCLRLVMHLHRPR